jgi:hypothetical protein
MGMVHVFLLCLLFPTVSGFLRMSAFDAKMHPAYDELARKLYAKYETRCAGSSQQQFWLCIAGGPGSGKSTMAAALAERVDALANVPGFSVVLPMDGYHYSRAELREIGERPGSEYNYEQLIARRGSPWTFDAPALCAALSAAKAARSGTLATYSRQKSDPVPGGVELKESHRVVIVEGNYLLNYDDPLWAPLRELFDERWYLSCASMEDQRQRLIKRHLETWSDDKTRMWGPGEAGAAAKADANDMLNAQYIATTEQYADLAIVSH